MNVDPKILDRLSAGKAVLDAEARAACMQLARQGTSAQAVRAIAVLKHAGLEHPPLPADVRAGVWPALPKAEGELRALMELASADSSLLRSYLAALFCRPGPSEKLRKTLLLEEVKRRSGREDLQGLAEAIVGITARLASADMPRAAARKRLLRVISDVLRKVEKKGRAHSGPVAADALAMFRAIGRLLGLPPDVASPEVSTVISMALDQAKGASRELTITILREVLTTLGATEGILRKGWGAATMTEGERLRRERIEDAAVALACTAQGVEDRDFARLLLAVTRSASLNIDDWIEGARGALALLRITGTSAAALPMLEQALAESALPLAISVASLQDASEQALREVAQGIRQCDAEIRRLQQEVSRLNDPQTVRDRAGDIIREELERQRALRGKLEAVAVERGRSLIERLGKALDHGESLGSAAASAEMANALREAIAFLNQRLIGGEAT